MRMHAERMPLSPDSPSSPDSLRPPVPDDELIDARRAAEHCGCTWRTFENYARTRRPASNPAPEHVSRDLATGRKLWWRSQVIAWHHSRTGSGRQGKLDR